jgi:hypothetical protein
MRFAILTKNTAALFRALMAIRGNPHDIPVSTGYMGRGTYTAVTDYSIIQMFLTDMKYA